jgi:TolA-binding protein
MNRLPAAVVGCGMALTLLAGAPARAQIESREGIALRDQILELRHELEQLREQGGAGGGQAYAPPPPSDSGGGGGSDINAQLLERISQLEDEVRQLRGRLDESDNAHRQAEADLNKQIGDLQFKLNGGAGTAPGLPAGPMLSPPPGVLSPGRAAPPGPPPARRTPEVALGAGYAALARRDYAGAEAAAREVLAAGRGPRGADAQFLLAQALAGERNYAAAAIAYDDSYKRNAHGLRGADSLLGLANSLTALGDKPAACQALLQLHAAFPVAPPALRPGIAAARGRAGCH